MIVFQSGIQNTLAAGAHLAVALTLPNGMVFGPTLLPNTVPHMLASACEISGASGANLSACITGIVLAGNSFTVDVRNTGAVTSDQYVITVVVYGTQGGQYVGNP